MNVSTNKKILIVGGGTAGWMTACLMAACWKEQGVDIALVESPEIGIIGVGEGSTPQLKAFFDYLQIKESEWMPACNATYKNGIAFKGWSTINGYENYFHPFESELDVHTQKTFFNHCDSKRNAVDAYTRPDRFFLTAKLAERKLAPIPAENFPFNVGYGYHFDSGLLGNFLRDKAKNLGVEHIQAKVNDVILAENGDVNRVVIHSGEILSADLFVDCSGFTGLIIQKALGVPFKHFSDNLFNDRAVAMPSLQTEVIESQTISTALKYGWAWEIPLTNRKGNGYVYSSAFCSADEAEKELRSTLGLLDADIEARHLKMNIGRVERHWERNCLAVGLSQGFIEPLEATALHIVQETIQGFIDAWEVGGFTDVNREQFNTRINNRFEGVRDYIVAHYICNSRRDTDYWIANRTHNAISDNLKAIIETWVHGGDLHVLVNERKMGLYYQPMSWYSLLSGYGIFPSEQGSLSQVLNANAKNLSKVDLFIERCTLNFRDQRLVVCGR